MSADVCLPKAIACVKRLTCETSLPVVRTGNKYESSARLVRWEGFSFIQHLCAARVDAGTEQVLGGTQARETTEYFCLGTSMLGMTSCYRTAVAAHWGLFQQEKHLPRDPGWCSHL